MDILTAIDDTITNPPQTLEAAQYQLDRYSDKVQMQLIAALYLGGAHLDQNELRSDTDWTRFAIDHIQQDEYADVLYKRRSVAPGYLKKLLALAKVAQYDLRSM